MFEELELFPLDEFEFDVEVEELNVGLVLFGLNTVDELDEGLGILTAGLCVVAGAFLKPPPFGLDLLIWPKAEREIDNGKIKSSNVFIRVALNGLINKSPL